MSRLLRKGTYMSRRTNKTLRKHLAELYETGKMSPWLEKRLKWDTVTRDQILTRMFNPYKTDFNDILSHYYQTRVVAEWARPSAFAKIVGVSPPESEDTWLAPYAE